MSLSVDASPAAAPAEAHPPAPPAASFPGLTHESVTPQAAAAALAEVAAMDFTLESDITPEIPALPEEGGAAAVSEGDLEERMKLKRKLDDMVSEWNSAAHLFSDEAREEAKRKMRGPKVIA